MEKKYPASGNNYPKHTPGVCLTVLAILSLAFTFTIPGEQKETKSGNVRKAAVAGGFYPANPKILAQTVDEYLRLAIPPEIKEPIRAIMVPHAG